MSEKLMQCKDIPDVSILEFLGRIDRWGTWFKYDDGTVPENSVLHAMPEGTPPKLALAKMRQLIRRGFVDGCGCGCRGDFFLTQKGREFLEEGRAMKLDLEAIKRRCEKATPGPWEVSPCGDEPYEMWDISDNSNEIAANYFVEANAEFVAASREDVPVLVAEVEKLRQLMRKLCEIADQCEGDVEDWAYRGYEFADKEIREALEEE